MDSYLLLTVLFICSVLPTLITLYITEKVKGTIKNSFDKKLEQVKRDHSLEISKFQTELSSLKAKENFKFTKLHEKRMVVLEDTYKYLNEDLNKLNKLVAPFKSFNQETTFEENEKVLFENFTTAHNKFASYYSDNKIYFNEQLEKLIDSYNMETINVYNDYSQNHFLKQVGEFDKDTSVKAAIAYKNIPEKIVPIKKEIEKRFKELLEQ